MPASLCVDGDLRITVARGAQHAAAARPDGAASPWSTDVNNAQRGVDWHMGIGDARRKLKSVYPQIKL